MILTVIVTGMRVRVRVRLRLRLRVRVRLRVRLRVRAAICTEIRSAGCGSQDVPPKGESAGAGAAGAGAAGSGEAGGEGVTGAAAAAVLPPGPRSTQHSSRGACSFKGAPRPHRVSPKQAGQAVAARALLK